MNQIEYFDGFNKDTRNKNFGSLNQFIINQVKAYQEKNVPSACLHIETMISFAHLAAQNNDIDKLQYFVRSVGFIALVGKK